MRDIQNDKPQKAIPVDKVGIKNLKYPIKVFDKKETEQHTVANINMYVSLPKNLRGTHMSRFVEILEKHKNTIAMKNMKAVLEDMLKKFNAESSHLEFEFPYFIEKESPRSKAKSLMEYECKFICSLSNKGRVKFSDPTLPGGGTGKELGRVRFSDPTLPGGTGFHFILGVEVPVATLCPCSKELVKYSAHSQRAKIKVFIRFHGFFWIEDLVKIIEGCASSSLYSLLKREDEKFITEWAYKHPVFVEDVVRNVAEELNKEKNIIWYSIEIESYESIHKHDAYAFIEKH